MIEDINVQLSLLGETGKGKVAAAKVTDGRANRVRTEEQIQFRVQRMAQKQLDNNLPGTNLRGKATESSFVLVCGDADHEKLTKLQS
jgi:hypothetical protein